MGRPSGRPSNLKESAMADTKSVLIECIVSPDVHIGDGRVLKGPVKEGTCTVKAGDVAEVDPEIAALLIDRGQVKETKRDVTVELPE
jgi:hypothetical protein